MAFSYALDNARCFSTFKRTSATGSLLSPVSVEPGGTLGSTGTVFNTVTNAGTVQPGLDLPAGTFGNLTVNNYVGAGGILALRTFLAGTARHQTR